MRDLHKRSLPAAAVGAVVLALALPAVSVQPSADATYRPSSRTEILHLALRNGTEAEVDIAQDGFGPGDYNVKVDEVFQGPRQIGQLTQQCIIMRTVPEPEPDVLLHCTITLILTMGQITVQGSFSVAEFPPTLAVTGGTGRYTGVWGELEETEGDGDATTMDLRLHYPRR